MKKICSVLILVLFGLSIHANPIALPTIEISELYFDDFDNWILELGYYEVDQNEFTVDSIFIYSSLGNIKLPSYEFTGNAGVLVITKDSFDGDLIIQRFADVIKVVSYINAEPFADSLIYGNLPGALINFPREGQSISKYGRCFVKDKSPTIGAVNDTIGMCGTLRGIVYDWNSEPVQNCSFYLDFDFDTSEDGAYLASVLAKPSQFNMIFYRSGYAKKSASISEISYTLEPDSIIELDIHLLDSLVAGISDIMFNDNPVKIYPNPVSINERIQINIDLPVIAANFWVKVFDINGRLVRNERINRQENGIESPAKNGYYIVSVWSADQMISSRRILVQ